MYQTQTVDTAPAIRELDLEDVQAVSGGFDWAYYALKYGSKYIDGLSTSSYSFMGYGVKSAMWETSFGGVGAVKFDFGSAKGYGVGITINL